MDFAIPINYVKRLSEIIKPPDLNHLTIFILSSARSAVKNFRKTCLIAVSEIGFSCLVERPHFICLEYL